MISATDKNDSTVEENLGLVHSCANKFRGRGVEYDDLFQAGCVGLVKASKSFDPQRGYAFSTYAVPVILGEIKRIFRDGGTVKVGRTLKERSMKAARIREKMANEMGREPTISELAEELGVDVEEASELITVSLPPVSLTVSEEDGGGQNDIPVESDDNDISDRLALKQVMDKLPERDRKLIKLRYFDGLTQNSTAELLGMSQVQVSRREKQLLLKMREELT